MKAAIHNRLLARATERARDLEPKLAGLVEPILASAGAQAARTFQQITVDHLNASAGRRADYWALASLTPAEARKTIGSLALTSAATEAKQTMICVKPRPLEAAAITDPDGEATDTLHVTLVYLGELDGDLGPILDALRPVAASHAPLAGAVGGYGQFGTPDGGAVGILLPDVPGLVELRVAVTDALVTAGIDYARNHGFEAHITIDSAAEPGEGGEMLTATGQPLHFDDLLLVRGDTEIHPLPLVGAPPLTAAGEPPNWTPPAGDELIDVDALIAGLRGKLDPVRLAVVKTMFDGVTHSKGPLIRAVTTRADADLLLKSLGVPDSEAARYIEAAISSVGEGYQVRVLVDDAGEVQGAVNWRPFEAYGDRYLVVDSVGSEVRGGGTLLLHEAAKAAQAEGRFVGAQGVSAAWDFYRKLGFEQRVFRGNESHWVKPGELLDEHDPTQFFRLRGDALDSLAADRPGRSGISFDVENPFTARVLAQSASQVTYIAETTRANVMGIIRASYEQGLSIPDTAKAIRAGMAEAAGYRAVNIARTELAGAVNGGSLSAVQIVDSVLGVGYKKKWMTADGAKDPRHELYDGLDGQTVALDGYFDVGGAALQYPGDPAGPPEEICQCRCSMSYDDESGGGEADAG